MLRRIYIYMVVRYKLGTHYLNMTRLMLSIIVFFDITGLIRYLRRTFSKCVLEPSSSTVIR